MTALNYSYEKSWHRNIQRALRPAAHIIWASLIIALSANTAFAREDKIPDFIGKISAEHLLSTYPEFAEEYANFDPSPDQLRDIQSLAGKEVITLFGTWCHDSEREVPRLLKLIELSNVQIKQLTLVAVSRQKDDPDGYSEKYELKYTPTIVISDEGVEIARVIERPKGNLAGDIAGQVNSTK